MEEKIIGRYQTIISAFTEHELSIISQAKRFFECCEGDQAFRQAADTGQFTTEQRNRLKEIGVLFDLSEVSLLWEEPKAFLSCINQINQKGLQEIPTEYMELFRPYPVLELWLRYSQRKKIQYDEISAIQNLHSPNPPYEKWRRRRIASAESELGAFNHNIDHPVLAFELSDGCSVQCWFCSFSAGKLTNVLDYKENKDYFRSVVQSCVNVLGRIPAGLALLYYATEPYDNPHYIDYMKEFEDLTGSTVCTSTAACAKKEWIDQLVEFYRPRNLPWPRLSILSAAMLRQVHENHSPEQLRDVSMVIQSKDSERPKVAGGRILEQQNDLRQRSTKDYLQEIIPQGTIACVSGFYINLIQKTIKLVSPCYTSEQWPYGYRVFDEAQFDSDLEFQKTLIDMIDRNMPETLPAGMPLRLRDDLVFRRMENGFDLVSPNQIHHFLDKPVFIAMARILAGPVRTVREASEHLLMEYGQNPFEVSILLNTLFHRGFLDEVGIGAYTHA